MADLPSRNHALNLADAPIETAQRSVERRKQQNEIARKPARVSALLTFGLWIREKNNIFRILLELIYSEAKSSLLFVK